MLRRTALALIALVAAAACSSSQAPAPSGPAASVAPALVVEQFLRAANANDLDTMARLFGTMDGPVSQRDTQKEIDDRMFALASILRHQDYSIEGEQIVPGRRDVATQLLVRMVLPDRRSTVVPFTLVYSKGRTWLIEQIAVERITNLR